MASGARSAGGKSSGNAGSRKASSAEPGRAKPGRGKAGSGPEGSGKPIARKGMGVSPQSPQPPEPPPLIVRGLLLDRDAEPLARHTVRAFDKELRSENLLGEVETNRAGRYEIRYHTSQFRRAGKASADLVVRAYSRDGREVASSPVLFRAGPEETIDLLVGGGEWRGASEYEELVAQITPLLDGVSLEDLTEDEKLQDLTFLSNETGVDVQRITQLVSAHRYKAETGLPAEVYYALLREGLPAGLPALLAQEPAVQSRALSKAAANNVVPARFGRGAGKTVAGFGKVAVRQAMKDLGQPATEEGRTSLVALVATALPTRAEQEKFLAAYASHTGTAEEFWAKVEKTFAGQAPELRFTLQAGALSGNHLPLVSELQRMKRAGEITSLADLARFSRQDWQEVIGRAGGTGRAAGSGPAVPAHVPGRDEAERARNYATAMAHMIEDTFPTAFVAYRLAEDSLPGKDDLSAFLKANPSFELRASRLESYLQGRPDALRGVKDVDGAKTRLKTFQRLYRVAPRYSQSSALMKGGIDSAHAIARLGRNAFAATYAADLGGQAQAALIHEKALQVQATVVNILAEYGTMVGRVGTRAVPDESVTDVGGIPEWAGLFGSIELCSCDHCRSVYSPAAYLVDLLHFLRHRRARISGKMAKDILFERRADLGEIELSCPNTDTPLPYVDLVNEILEDAVKPPQAFASFNLAAGYEAQLNSRSLSAGLKNSFSPHLSSDAVITVGQVGQAGSSEDPWWTIDDLPSTYDIRKQSGTLTVTTRSRQTKGTAAERAANPQYVNAGAYEVLRGSVYPWTLPFDLWTAEARAYLDHLGVPRYQVMEAFLPGQRQDVLSEERLAYEYLGLTADEAKIVTGVTTGQAGSATPGIWNLWGFAAQSLTTQKPIPDPSDSTAVLSSGQWLTVLGGRVDVFLQQSGLEYRELLDLLDCHYVNPIASGTTRTITIVSTDTGNPDTCQTSKLSLQGLNSAGAHRMARFLRLWRALGWSMRDLDRAITAFHPAGLDDTFLTQLSHVQRLHDQDEVPVIRLLGWWAPLDTALYFNTNAAGRPRLPSLYEQLFRNRAVTNPLDAAFVEDPAALTGTLSSSATTIAAALGTSAADLTLLMGDRNVLPADPTDAARPDDRLTLDYLSRLARHAGLAKALKLTVRQHLSALELIDTAPFTSTVRTLLFAEKAEKLAASGFTTVELDYLLRHVYTSSSGVAPAEEAVATILDEIRGGLRKMASENTFRAETGAPDAATTDPGGDVTRQKLALLKWDAGLVDDVIATLGGTVVYEATLATLPAGLKLPNDTGSYEVTLSALPSGFSIPSSLAGVVSHEGGKLKTSRTLDTSEWTALTQAATASGDPSLISAVTDLLQSQDEMRGKITYKGGKLCFAGPMTQARRARLESAVAASETAYLEAIEELFDAPRNFISHHMRTFSVQDFSTALAALPNGVKFPASLKERVYFDASGGPAELHFLGPMTAGERDSLLALSKVAADPYHAAYQAAVTTLYARPDAYTPETGDAFLTVSGAGNDAATMFDDPTTPEKRFLLVLEKLLPYLCRTLSEQLALQKLAEALGLEAKAAEGLISRWMASPSDTTLPVSTRRRALADFLATGFAESNTNVKLTAAAFPTQFRTYILLGKVATLATKFRMTWRQLGWLFDYGAAAGWPDPNSLPSDAADPAASFDGWLRLVDLFTLRDGVSMGETTLDELFTLTHTAGTTGAEALEYVADNIQWNETDLGFLVGGGGFALTLPADFQDERALVRLRQCFAVLKRLGMSAELCWDIAGNDVSQTAAGGVVRAARAKYDESQWLRLARPLRNVLREKQRSALVDYLVVHPDKTKGQVWRKPSQVFAHFLIDVEMTPCMLTSRIKQAISSTQLFVQRSLMNLEKDVAAQASVDQAWRWWKWMKNYRVWEANRTIFLYPENWLEPDLRDGKSPFFEELEGELLQGDLTKEAAEDAYLAYLEKLNQVARLEVVGVYRQLEATSDTAVTSTDVLHVFARTYGAPHTYYYRRRVDSSEWEAWQRLEVDIEGDHLVPVLWNRRLFLFWPIFTEKAAPASTMMPGEGEYFAVPNRYWEVQLAWSEYRQGKWSDKKVSTGYVTTDYTVEKERYMLRSYFSKDQLVIALIFTGGENFTNTYGGATFVFDPSRPDPSLSTVSNLSIDPPTGASPSYMFFEDYAGDGLYLPVPSTGGVTDTRALNKTPTTYDVLPHADGSALSRYPFFYLDGSRAFFVTPQLPVIHLIVDLTIVQPGVSARFLGQYFRDLARQAGPGRPPGDPDPPLFEQGVPIQGGPGGPDPADWVLGAYSGVPAAAGPFIGAGPEYATRAYAMTMSSTPAATPSGIEVVEGVEAPSVAAAGRGILVQGTLVTRLWQGTTYQFHTFYHPYVKSFIRELNRDGVDGLLQRKVQTEPQLFLPPLASGQAQSPLDFKATYEPDKVPTPIVLAPYPREDVDFGSGGAYSLYNWELFFHAPLMIADRLSLNQRFEEAQKWFHYIFDPTDSSSIASPQRYWRTKPFYQRTRDGYRSQQIDYILKLLAAGGDPTRRAQLEADQLEDLTGIESTVTKWRKYPFKPHIIARLRTAAYQKTVVMKYLDNLIGWGDQLFRRDTIESINEAAQLYVLASDILGRRPEEIPPRLHTRPKTYNGLEPKLDDFSNALEDLVPASASVGVVSPGDQATIALPGVLHFCIPRNEKLLGYWDTVADRLFKIRHCMNIEGVVRQLPLFEPPIDPGLLVRAVAAGVDLSSVLGDITAAPPYYRFNVLAQKATELCGEVKSLGGALLSALEKRDAEKLSLLRTKHETAVLKLVESVRQQQVKEAATSREALEKTRDVVAGRYLHYQKLLGVQSPQVPAVGQPAQDVSPSQHASVQDKGGVPLIQFEKEELDGLETSHTYQQTASGFDIAASVAHIVPNWNMEPWGVGATFGGSNVGNALSAFAGFFRAMANQYSYEASRAGKMAQYALRAHEWGLQSNLAGRELMQVDKQILAAQIREEIATRELANHRKQMDNADEIEKTLRDKYTNQELYVWMVGQVAGVYFQAYQLAYDTAKRAERAYRYELGLTDSNFIRFGYWDSLKRGLLAGEKLHGDLKRMEMTYLDQHKREYEIVKHISLAQLDPLALIRLRESGGSYVSVPEALFDLDCPGHYLRRLKSVSLSVPCVTGPYTGVNCTLTLLGSSIRHGATLLGGKYARQEDDTRFTDLRGAIESIVTSSGSNDSGLFEANLRDERYLPFEGAGAVSEWQIHLPRDFRAFDYDTISDVVLHLRYTARDGGEPLKQQAASELQAQVNQLVDSEDKQGLARLFSLRHEFSTAWNSFLYPPSGATGDQSLELDLGKSRFPFLFQGKTITITALEVYVKVDKSFTSTHDQSKLKLSLAAGSTASTTSLTLSPWNGLLQAEKAPAGSPGAYTLAAWLDPGTGTHQKLTAAAIEDIFLVCRYTIE